MSTQTGADIRGTEKEKTERVTVRVEQPELEQLEALVDQGVYKDRSKAIRHGIDMVLAEEGDDV